MILWYGIATVVVSLLASIVCIVEGSRKRGPNDYTMGATLLVAVLLVVQIVIAILAPFFGNRPEGDLLEFWMYLVVAAALPVGAGIWALVDRSRWANLVLAVVALAVSVMTYRMLVIWGA